MAATEELQGEELEAILDQLHKKLERTRVLYEQYFLGIEKTPPTQVQKDIVRIIYRLQKAKIHGASGKFRFQALMQRFSAHKAYWARTVREIEEGRYKRQTFRAQQRKRDDDENDGDPLTTEDYLAIRMIKDTQGEEAAAAAEEERRKKRQADLADAASGFMEQLAGGTAAGPVVAEDGESAPAPQAAGQSDASGSRKSAADIRGMSADEIARKQDKLKELRERMQGGVAAIRAREQAGTAPAPRDVDREIYERFVAAKQKLNQATDSLSFESVKSSLERQRAKVRQKHDCARVDFDIVVKDGNAFLKPIPVKDA